MNGNVTERSVLRATIVVERVYDASPDRVFAAWSDQVAHGSWHVPGGNWTITGADHDFRVGGREFSRFGQPGAILSFRRPFRGYRARRTNRQFRIYAR